MAEVETQSRTDEIRSLNACINDLVSVLALPGTWTGREEPSLIVTTLLESLLSLLRLDFAYLRLSDPFGGGGRIEMIRLSQRQSLTAQPEEVCRALTHWLTDDPSRSSFLIQNPLDEKISITFRRLGLQDETGVLVAGSARTDFPTRAERVVLDVAVNQAMVGLHQAWRLIEQREIALELDNRVSQRTRELVERDARIRRLVDANIIGVFIEDLEGQILECNDAFLKIVGYSREDLVSEQISWTDLTPAEWHGVSKQARAQIKATGTCEAFEKEYCRRDGSRVPVLIGGAGFGGDSFVAFVVDLTERKRAEEAVRQSEKQLRDVIETMPVIAFTTLPDGCIEFVNRRWIEYTGFTAEGAGFYQQVIVHSEDNKEHIKKWQGSLASGEPFENEARHRGADGQYRWFLVRCVPLRNEDGSNLKWFGTLTDIEGRKQAEQRLQNENVALREEIDKASMFEEIVGISPALHAVLSRVSKVAPTDSTVLITGETGTGKELIARAVHKRSQRCSRAFVGVNCAAIPRDLIASELFGHEKGAIAADTFRSDLFYRLNVFPIEVPSLRERKEDIPVLVEYFIDRYASKAGKSIRGVNKKSLELLQSYPWPGNVRELQNVIERSVIVCDTENFSVDESWLSRQPLASEPKTRLELARKPAAKEKEIIEGALRGKGGRVYGPSVAASKLGIPRSTLESKIRSLKISKSRFKAI